MFPQNQLQYNVNVVKCIMIQTGTYDDMPTRAFTGSINGETINAFQHATNNGTLINAQSIAPIATHLIAPEASPSGLAQIQNGWGNQRIRFLLELAFTSPMGDVTSQYLTGYTDYPGVTRVAGSADRVVFDPQMHLFINNIITINRGQYNGVELPRVWDASQLIFQTGSVQNLGFQQPAPNTQFLMTPEEVLNRVGISYYGQPHVDVTDLRGKLNISGMAKSRRSNCLPSTYLAKTVSELHNQQMANGDDQFFNLASIAAKNLSELPDYTDKALNLLNKLSFNARGSITYGELNEVCPDTDTKTAFIDKTVSSSQIQAAQSGAHANFLLQGAQRGSSAPLTGSNEETIVATIVAQAVPAIMTDLMLTSISFSANNLVSVGNDFAITIHGFKTFLTDVDITPQLQQFLYRLKNEILIAVTFNGQKPIKLDATVDILGDTFIGIQMNSHNYEYQVPSFCDALLTPVVTSNIQQLDTVAGVVHGLVSSL